MPIHTRGVTVPYQFQEWELVTNSHELELELVTSSHELELNSVISYSVQFLSAHDFKPSHLQSRNVKYTMFLEDKIKSTKYQV